MKAALLALMGTVLASSLYVLWHLWRLTPGSVFKVLVCGLFILWMASFFVSFLFLEKVPLEAAFPLYGIGNTWLIAFLYILMAFVLLDLASICHLLPKGFLKESWPVLIGVFAVVGLILSLGGIHYHHKYREEISLTSSKPMERPLTIVMASDLHLGYHNRRAELSRWIDLINAENPDLVLFGGDVLDRSLRPVVAGDYASEFHRLAAPAYAVLGNHEYYGDIEGAEAFYKDAGITLLKDSFADVSGIRLLGRNDRSYPCRAALSDIIPVPVVRQAHQPVEGAVPEPVEGPFTILLDHQPSHLEEAEEAGIDFQFSGHTHRGQVWPISWITDAIFEKSWGRHQRGSTQSYISLGLGIWGAKVRIGTRSEYLVLHVLQEGNL